MADFCIHISSLNTIRVIAFRRMRYGRHLSRIGEKTNTYRILMGKYEE
jgi:hypothetical protein